MAVRSFGGLCKVTRVLPLWLLAGCPQLMTDDFGHQLGSHDAPLPFVDGPADASVNPAIDGDAGPDASDAVDASVVLPDVDAGPDPIPSGDDAGAIADAAVGGDEDAATVPDSGAPPDPTDPIADALHAALVHRYRFDPGATLLDSVGTAHATNFRATFSGGAAVFSGAAPPLDQYLDLPNDLLTGLTDVSLEAWVIWEVANPSATTSEWQRIFDFGTNTALEGQQGDNVRDLYLSPRSGGAQGKLHLEFNSNGRTNVDGPEPMPNNVLVQVVAVLSDTGNTLSVYQDAVLAGALGFTGTLSTLAFKNNWLGRSNYTGNAAFQGRMLDFRVYSTALTPTLISASFAAGADADW